MAFRLLLVQPPYIQVPGRFNQSPPVPPLGIAYLAAHVRSRFPEWDVRIIDAFSLGWDEARIVREIADSPPDVVGYSTVTLTANAVRRISERVRATTSDILQIAGGPHPSALPGDLLPSIDLVVRGEGELTLAEILEARMAGRSFDAVAGLSFLREAERIDTPPRRLVENLDELPFPARDLLPGHLYEHHYPYRTRTRGFTTLFTSRGCPFACKFCSQHVIWNRRVRYRSLDNTFEEIGHIVRDHDVSFCFFYDDTFTARRDRVLKFCERMSRGNFGIKWACLTRADCLDDDLLDRMRRAGCVELQIGVESGSDDVLASIEKKTDMETLHRAFRSIHRRRIRTKGFFILGHLSDTPVTLQRTIDTALRLDPTWVFFSTLVPLPGSELFDIAVHKGFLETTDWDRFNYHGMPVIHTDHFTAAELDALRGVAYRRFYLRLRKLLRYGVDVVSSRGYRRMWNNFLAFIDLAGKRHEKHPHRHPA